MWILRINYLDGIFHTWTLKDFSIDFETKSVAMQNGISISKDGLWIADGHDRCILILPHLIREISIYRKVI